MDCPLGICDGSGFYELPLGAPGDGREVEDEDNCPHADYPMETWTAENVSRYLTYWNGGAFPKSFPDPL